MKTRATPSLINMQIREKSMTFITSCTNNYFAYRNEEHFLYERLAAGINPPMKIYNKMRMSEYKFYAITSIHKVLATFLQGE
jgi:hypothetical protein